MVNASSFLRKQLNNLKGRTMKLNANVNVKTPSAFTIRNHAFDVQKPSAFTIRNHAFTDQKVAK
jgi:hypothetical protein